MFQWLAGLLRNRAGNSADVGNTGNDTNDIERRLRTAYQRLQGGDTDGAGRLAREVLTKAPENTAALNLQAILAHRAGSNVEAVALLERAASLDPRVVDYHFNLGVALQAQERHAEAIRAYRNALSLQPRHAPALTNLGRALQKLVRPQEAVASFERALALQPDLPEAHWGLATQLLLIGEFARGWDEYEHRWKLPENRGNRREFGVPRWEGGAVAGHRLLLQAEQGAGDTLQFVRYAPLLAERGARVVVLCQPALKRLLMEMEAISVVTDTDPLPALDFHVPLMSLPRLFGTLRSTIPANVPYLRPDPMDVRAWSEKLGGGHERKIGIVWAGNRRHLNDRNRSCPLETFDRLAEVGGLRFYSLLKNEPGGAARSRLAPVDLAPALVDFADTAAVLMHLDLVITVDTAVAHLAGALGRPVWLLLPFAPDWRWLLERRDSPWYPSMRLFRQGTPGDWQGVMTEVVAALQTWSQPS